MGRIANTEGNMYDLVKAKSVFTDRTEPQEAFRRNVAELVSQYKKGQSEIKVITYYGYGGIGKSRLCKELINKIGSELDEGIYKNLKYIYFSFEEAQESTDVLMLMARKLENIKEYKFTFPLFDYAMFYLGAKTGLDINKPEMKALHQKSIIGSHIIDATGLLPVVGDWAVNVLKVLDSVQSSIRQLITENQQEIKDMDSFDVEMLREKIPYYFAKDMRNNLKKDKYPFVFFLDTYEQLTNHLTDTKNAKLNDEWVWNYFKGFICQIPALYVIAGHNKLDWGKYDEGWDDPNALEQHLLNNLDNQDIKSYLDSVGIYDIDIQDVICEESHGIPVHMDLCAELYYQRKSINNQISADLFRGGISKLANRIVGNMTGIEKDTIYTLVCFENWTDEELRKAYSKFNISDDIYNRIKRLSFINVENDIYSMHSEVRTVLLNNYEDVESKKALYLEYIMELIKDQNLNSIQRDKFFIQYIEYQVEMIAKLSDERYEKKMDELYDNSYMRLKEYIDRFDHTKVEKCFKSIYKIIFQDTKLSKSHVMFKLIYLKYLNIIGEFRKSNMIIENLQSSTEYLNVDKKAFFVYQREKNTTNYALGNYHLCLNEALRLFEKYRNEFNVAFKYGLNIPLNIGEAYFSLGNYDEALNYFQKSFDYVLKEETSDNLTCEKALIESKIGDVYKDKGDQDKALEYYEMCLEVFEVLNERQKSDASLSDVGIIHCKIGDAYIDKADQDKALEHYERTLEVSEVLNERQKCDASLKNVGISHSRIGDVYRDKGDQEKALEHYEKDLEVSEVLNERQKSDASLRAVGISQSRIGDVYINKGDQDKALEHYEKYLEVSEVLNERQKSDASLNAVGISHSKIGDVYKNKGDQDKALEHYEKDLEVSKVLNERQKSYASLRNVSISHCKLRDIYTNKGDQDKAREHYEKFLALYDEMKTLKISMKLKVTL